MIHRSAKALVQYARIGEDLRRRILSGEFAEGTALPGELLLSDTYGVSRKTVRKALETLRTQNFIRKHQGSGNFVIPASERAQLPRCTGKISVLLPGGRAAESFGEELLAGICKSAAASSLSLSLLPQDTPVSVLLEMYYNFETDAFLWGEVPHPLPDAAGEIARRRIPQVIVNDRMENSGSVLYTSRSAWCALLNGFYCAGHKQIVFIDRQEEHFWTVNRQQDFLEAARRFELSGTVLKLREDAQKKLISFIEQHPECTAYVAARPFTEAFLAAAEQTGRKLPADLSWAEFTPDDISPEPDAARIHIAAQKMGSEAVHLLTSNNFTENPGPAAEVPCFAVMGLSVAPVKKQKNGENL